MAEDGFCVIVCGGRDFDNEGHVFNALSHFEDWRGPIKKLVHGNARGADTLAADWGHRMRIKTVAVPANWKKHGKAAGAIRNQQMLDIHRPDIVIAFDGGRGIADMVRRAEAEGVEVVRL